MIVHPVHVNRERTIHMALSNRLCACLCVTLFCLTALPSAAQETRVHSVGNVRWALTDGDVAWSEGFGGDLEWPVGRGERNRGMLVAWTPALHVGELTDLTGSTVTNRSYGGHLTENIVVPGSFRKVVRRAPPEVIVNGQRMTAPLYDEIDPSLPADEMTEVSYKLGAGPGFLVTRRTYAFANPEYDDFVIVEYEYQYTRDSDQEEGPDWPEGGLRDVTFGLNVGAQLTPAGNRSIQLSASDTDEWGSWTTYTGPRSGRPVTFTYLWDGDSPATPGDDTGDPATTAIVGVEPAVGPLGRFLSEAYVGFGPLQVSPAVNDLTGHDESMPYSIERRNRLDVFGNPSQIPGEAISTGQRVAAAIDSDPSASPPTSYANLEYQGYGPYAEMQEGDRVRIVLVVAFGGISQELAISEGVRYERGAMGDAEKNALLATGLDSLRATIDRAAEAWDSGFAVTSSPAAPDLTVDNGPSLVELSWTSVPGAVQYRVYRADEDYLNPFSLITTTPGTAYTDTEVVPAVPYFYYVTAVDAAGRESSISLNRMQGADFAALPFEPGASTSRQVRVVPNPYVSTAGAYQFPENSGNTIKFFNLPAQCTLRIYTETGDLLRTIVHDDLSDREDWDLTTDDNQFPATGIYLLAVTDARDLAGNGLGDAFTKFVIIR